jgi:hypothetical protein
MLPEVFYRINDYTVKISERNNHAVCICMVVLCLTYCVTGIIQFSEYSGFASLFNIAYLFWIGCTILILKKYSHNPFLVIGVYMAMMASEQLVYCYTLYLLEYDEFEIAFQVGIGICMMSSSYMWLTRKLFTRIPSILFTSVSIMSRFSEIPTLIDVLPEFDNLLALMIPVTSFLLIAMLICLLVLIVCNRPYPTHEERLKLN